MELSATFHHCLLTTISYHKQKQYDVKHPKKKKTIQVNSYIKEQSSNKIKKKI